MRAVSRGLAPTLLACLGLLACLPAGAAGPVPATAPQPAWTAPPWQTAPAPGIPTPSVPSPAILPSMPAAASHNPWIDPDHVRSVPPADAGSIFPPDRPRTAGDAAVPLSPEERESLALACRDPATVGAAAYRQCVTGHLDLLAAGGQRPDLELLTPSERSGVELACREAKARGPVLYNRCRAAEAAARHR